MVSVFSPVKEMEASDYKRVTDVLYLGFVHGTLAALRRMLPRDRGTIIQIGSALSYRSIPLQSAYCACKHAINGFTDTLRCELHHDNSNVKVTAVQMPAMNTTQFDWVKNRMLNDPQLVPPKSTDRYVPRIFGFKLHDVAKQHRYQDMIREESHARIMAGIEGLPTTAAPGSSSQNNHKKAIESSPAVSATDSGAMAGVN